jgi:broad specificity phosphatase PhoE
MRIVLVRHGQTEWNVLRKTQGHQNSDLTQKGIAQADLVARELSRLSFQHFVCSDSGRAVQTAERILAVHPGIAPLKLDRRLRELNYGDWERLQHDEVVERYPREYQIYRKEPSSFRAPNGESFQELEERFVDFLEAIVRTQDGDSLLVTHSGLIRVALLVFKERPLSDLWGLGTIPEASITIAEQGNGSSWNLVKSCATDHLRSLL